MIHTPIKQRNKGFTILLSVLVIGAVALSVGVSLMFFGTKALQNTEAIQSSALAKFLTQACMEDALEKIKDSGGQTSSGNLTLSGESCSYVVTDLGGESRRIQATSTVKDTMRSIDVTITSFIHDINFSSWTEQ